MLSCAKVKQLNKDRIIPITALVFAMYMLSPGIQAQDEYYTWIDENGVTNFSQRDPKNYDATYISREASRFGYRTNPRQAAPSAETSEPATAQQQDQADPQLNEQREEVQQEIARIKASNCNVGKRNLARLEAYARIRVKGPDGQETVLSDDDKRKRIADARRTISENCTNG